MDFHPGLRVRIQTQNFGPVLAEIVEVILPDRIMDLKLPGEPPESVADIMRKEGIVAALLVKTPGRPGTFVIECMDDGRFREMHSRQSYVLEAMPVEIKTEVQ